MPLVRRIERAAEDADARARPARGGYAMTRRFGGDDGAGVQGRAFGVSGDVSSARMRQGRVWPEP
jgi:hypothetical protein